MIALSRVLHGLALAGALAALPLTAAATPETEVNNEFAARNVLAVGTTSVEGSLTVGSDVGSISGNLLSETIQLHTIFGLTPFTVFFATTSDGAGGPPVPDTILGWVADSSFSTLIDFNDDDGPGLGSMLSGVSNAAGEINLAVTGFPDILFNADHFESGAYTLSIASINDIDFFSFVGLLPGSVFVAEIFSDEDDGFDTILGLFDDAGVLIDSDDDGGVDLLSALTGTVGASGILNFAVTGFDDDPDFIGDHAFNGGYILSLTAELAPPPPEPKVPEPGTLALLGLGLAGLGLARRRRDA